MANEKTVDVSLFADFDMENVADLPEFTTYPVGSHTVKLKMEIGRTDPDAKKLAEGKVPQRFVKLAMAYINPLEIGEGVEPPKAGDMDSQTFWIDNEWGAGQLKAATAGLSSHFGTTNIAALYEQCKEGIEVVVTTKHSWDKGQERTLENARTQIVKLAVL